MSLLLGENLLEMGGEGCKKIPPGARDADFFRGQERSPMQIKHTFSQTHRFCEFPKMTFYPHGSSMFLVFQFNALFSFLGTP